jgi:hypothetical protein
VSALLCSAISIGGRGMESVLFLTPLMSAPCVWGLLSALSSEERFRFDVVVVVGLLSVES